MSKQTTSEEFFESMYRSTRDPWNFAASAYEQSRYSLIIDTLRGRHFRRALEPGCSVGVLTEQLAAFCDNIEAFDLSETAVQQARQRCCGLPNIRVEHGCLPSAIPAGKFDLILFSEIGYYFDDDELMAIIHRLMAQLATGGLLIAAHWLGTSQDHLLSGDRVHELIAAAIGIDSVLSQRHGEFRLEQWVKE